MVTNLGLILGILNLIWLVILSVLVWKNKVFLDRVFPIKEDNFKDRLEIILGKLEEVDKLKEEGLKHIQKIALKRYNPYHDTGGDQSFSASFIDGEGNGFIMTSLHARAGTRMFAKPVKSGKQTEYELSNEEQEVLKEASLNFREITKD